ncbi:hypothetical protein [uncultured Tenacibaculum sp.]|uniref:hypothetical protein n=1 Tax=uncultured Tenacibaculum sp. TaxID=174713 RepID=UPI00262BC173|nr:hypothetical protein [uncultured Tenacibaculum sp.]
MKVFKEEQRFIQLWLIVLLAVSTIVPLVIVIREYLNDKTSLYNFLATLALILFATGFIFFFKLKTRIDEYGIHYQFFPFHLKSRLIKWSFVKKAYIRKYDAISEYGGWGLKNLFWKKNGRAINVSGNIGIQLEFVNGKKLLIGTLKEQEATSVLQTYKSKITST